jgi:hypothetical protein
VKTIWPALLVTLLLAAPTVVQAQFYYSVNADNTVTITGYYGPDGNVSIPGTINALSVTSIGANAFYEDLGLANVTIPGSVTNIGDYAEWPLDKA